MARIVILRGLHESLAAGDQEIDDVVAHRVIKRMPVEIGARALFRQRVLDDLGQHRARAVGHQHDAVGEIDRLVDVMRDHEHGLSGLDADAADLVLQGAAGERVERRERLVHQHDLRLDRQGARDADALLHAAGQFRRPLLLGAGEADEVDEFLRLRAHLGLAPTPPFRRHREGDVAHHAAPGQQRMALEDHGAIEARAMDRLVVDDHGAVARRIEAGQDVEHRGLAAARMPDDAGEVAALHREPQVFEDRVGAARLREAPRDVLDGNEFVGHRSTCHSGNVTRRVSRASTRSSSMPTTPMTRIAMITLVIDRLFHSFQTK